MPTEEYILITGGAGYIGSHTAKCLAGKGYRTLILDNLSLGHRELARWGEFIQGEVADTALLDSVFRNYPVSAVVHFAASAYVGESVRDPAKYYRNNVVGTLGLLDSMRRHGVQAFIFSSTCATYGNPRSLPITEISPQEPINPYGRSKLMVERIVGDYGTAYGLRSVLLRYFNAAGADPEGETGEWHDPETHLIPLALAAASGVGNPLTIFGTGYDTPDGTCIRDYIHVSDLAEAHLLALEHLLRGGSSEALNLGTGRGYSVREIVRVCEEVTGRSVPVIEGAAREGDPPLLVASPAKARTVLGWQARYGLREMIEDAWNWHVRQLRHKGGNSE